MFSSMQSRSQTFTFLCCSAVVCISLNIWICLCSALYLSIYPTNNNLSRPLQLWKFQNLEIFLFPILMWPYIISNDLFSMSFLSKDWIWEMEKFVEDKQLISFSEVYLKIPLATEVIKKIMIIILIIWNSVSIYDFYKHAMAERVKRGVALNCLVSQLHFKIPLVSQ